jgi:hypothetical protein
VQIKARYSAGKGWPFGYVYVNKRQNCDCGSPVYELAFCNECNEPHLLARDKKGKLVQWENKGGDEFSCKMMCILNTTLLKKKLRKRVVTALHSLSPQKDQRGGLYPTASDRRLVVLVLVNNDSIPLLLTILNRYVVPVAAATEARVENNLSAAHC